MLRLKANILNGLAMVAFFLPAGLARGADASNKEGLELFEKRIRPLLVDRCYECHSTQAGKSKGHLLLDSKQGLAKGGESGPALVPGDIEGSRLVKAIRWTDPDLQMPPKKQLDAQQVAWVEQWVKLGAPDPRDAASVAAAGKTPGKRTIDIEAGKKWWAFQPVAELPTPAVTHEGWGANKIDAFIAAELEKKKLDPSPAADRRTLIQRATLDLTGLRATYEEVETFVADKSPDAYPKLIERLLGSPHYGERWGRYWMDVTRYAEDNPTGEATTPPYPYAWRYRDWVIKAMNQDVPYDRFVKLQLAADLMPDAQRSDLAALSYLGAAPQYHKDGRLSKDVIQNLYNDDWDERVDAVSRGLLGLTVACARCHDHKFDPITSNDYYSLMSVFASTVAAPRPVEEVDAATETRFMVAANQLFYLSYVSNLLRGDPGTKKVEARQKVERFVERMEEIKQDMSFLRDKHPAMYTHLVQIAKRPDPYPDAKPATRPTTRPAAPPIVAGAGAGGFFNGGRRRFRGGSTEPFYNAVFDAGLFVNGSDPDLTMLDVKAGTPHDLRRLNAGNVTNPGEPAPRGFLSVLAKGDKSFHKGSGRLELADRIFTDAAPLTARVIVNRVWGWHFGKPLVETPSDFGAQGDKPSHPQLLDDLAARFIAHGWSLKWLHREIMLSQAYQQASHPRADGMKLDPGNRLVWRMTPRRLDVEAYRDCLLQACGDLDTTNTTGPSSDVDQPDNHRRTVYGRISRGRMSSMLQLYDFPEPVMHSPERDTTTSPLQQLFVMNSPFMEDQARALVARVKNVTEPTEKIRTMYHDVFARNPSRRELALAEDYLKTGTLNEYAHALLCANEVIFWP